MSWAHPDPDLAFIPGIEDCQVFCGKLGQGTRLPTEAEWEYACRGGSTYAFCFGNEETGLGEYAWFGAYFGGNSRKTTNPVGVKSANGWGLHDMHGNVWEWCSDRFDPQGTPGESCRVFRGGS